MRFSLPPKRHLKRHHLPPAAESSRYRPPPVWKALRFVGGLGFADAGVGERYWGQLQFWRACCPHCCPLLPPGLRGPAWDTRGPQTRKNPRFLRGFSALSDVIACCWIVIWSCLGNRNPSTLSYRMVACRNGPRGACSATPATNSDRINPSAAIRQTRRDGFSSSESSSRSCVTTHGNTSLRRRFGLDDRAGIGHHKSRPKRRKWQQIAVLGTSRRRRHGLKACIEPRPRAELHQCAPQTAGAALRTTDSTPHA